MIELKPLSTFNATHPEEINDTGQVVGKSFIYSTPFSPPPPHNGPDSTATLWKNGIPTALTTSKNYSKALKINNKGEILYVQYDNPFGETSNSTYFLWKEGTVVDLKTLVPNLKSVIDLNDNSLILGQLDANDPARNVFLFDLDANTLVLLPPFVVNGKTLGIIPMGIDNVGRVVVISNIFQQGTTSIKDIYWLPPGGTSWNNSGIWRISNLLPSLNKDGWLLAVAAVDQAGVGCYLDLINPDAPLRYISRIPPPADPAFQVVIPMDANALGRIVGQEISSGSFLYDTQTNIFYLPELNAGWRSDYARRINVQGQVVGYGTKNYGTPTFQQRGWVIEWHESYQLNQRYTFPQHIPWPWPPEIPIPGPVERWAQQLPPEKRDILITLALGESGSLLNNPELKQIFKRAEIELLEKATQIAIRTGR